MATRANPGNQTAESTAPANDVARALDRFGLGARPGEQRGLDDPRGWLKAQLERSPASLGGKLASRREVLERTTPPRNQGPPTGRPDPEVRRELRQEGRRIFETEAVAAFSERVRSEQPFVERLVSFWSNHLCVSTTNLQAMPWAGLYEREAIRPHVLGRFADLLRASAQHPAMLIYLDNIRSVGPDSQVGRNAQRGGRTPGLNENYARELLELHTMGSDGGYSQDDVIELARVLTGWSVAGIGPTARAAQERMAQRRETMNRRRAARTRDGQISRGRPRHRPARPSVPTASPGEFLFIPILHQPGTKTVAGKLLREAGIREGIEAIEYLATLPSTAHFLATKLARHFIADDPPPSVVSHLAKAYLTSGGHLGVTARALIDLPEAWDPSVRKFRTPQDWLIAVLRAAGAEEFPRPALPILRRLRHFPWSPMAPNGYSDFMADWADPASLMARADVARALADGPLGRALAPERLIDAQSIRDDSRLGMLLRDQKIPAAERTALALASPAFQWR